MLVALCKASLMMCLDPDSETGQILMYQRCMLQRDFFCHFEAFL